MTWASAVAWAANLEYYDAVRDVTWTDWRLPATQVPDAGCSMVPPVALGAGCTGSELGHMYYVELGAPVINPAVPTALPDPGPFTNLIADGYWSGTEYDASFAYVVNFGFAGQQAGDQKSLGYFAWAVRDGDVSAVPLPAASWLLGTAVVALVARTRRQRSRSVYRRH